MSTHVPLHVAQPVEHASISSKALAILEVSSVFVVVLLMIFYTTVITQRWQQALGYPFFEYLWVILIPVLWLLITRRKLADFGIAFVDLKFHLSVAMTSFLPVAVSLAVFAFLPYRLWYGALITAAIQVGVLWWIARALTGKSNVKSGIAVIVIASIMFATLSVMRNTYPGLLNGIKSLVFYLLFLGLGEELLYRGFILTRLNQVFEKPYQFFGVRWGWGVIIAALFFGLFHVIGNGYHPLTHQFAPEWWWGFWTAFAALPLSYVREKTGSILASTILHGLPQGLMFFFLTGF